VGEVDQAFAGADVVAETTFEFGRHTGVTLNRAARSHTGTRPSSA
jgi:hypothetical protein